MLMARPRSLASMAMGARMPPRPIAVLARLMKALPFNPFA